MFAREEFEYLFIHRKLAINLLYKFPSQITVFAWSRHIAKDG